MACDSGCQSQINALKCSISKLDKDVQVLWNDIYSDSDGKRKAITFVADHGNPDTDTYPDFTNLSTRINEVNTEFDLVGLLFGGDNNYPDGEYSTLSQAWAPYDQYILDKRVFPALGNHDLDNSGTPGQPQFDKFSYLDSYGSNRRYYHVPFDDMDVDLFVLNSGTSSSPEMLEADGISIGSEQYNWFISSLQNSSNKFKIVMFHHPFATMELDASAYPKFIAGMDWRFENLGVHLVLNGHAHADFHIVRRNSVNDHSCNIVNCSAINEKRQIEANPLTVYGSNGGGSAIYYPQWHYADEDGEPPEHGDLFTIVKYGNALHCSFISLISGTTRYSFIIT